MPTPQTARLRSVAQAIAAALPEEIEDVVLTGSVSRGMADDVSDIEMLVVTPEEPDLAECFALAGRCGLANLGTWGPQGGRTQRVSGMRDGVPIELIWWSRAQAAAAVDEIFTGGVTGSADALAHGVALRTSGLLEEWQDRLREYPDALAEAHIDDAALTWGGFAAAGLLTLTRPGERVAAVERMVDDASRVVRIVFAVNRVWPPTLKRLAVRSAVLPIKPDGLAERIDAALTEPDLRKAVLAMTELQLETALLAPDTPNIVRARQWLAEGQRLLA